jgi:hypothetical protein
MNISKPIMGSICLEHQENGWIQKIEYKHISFHYKKWHEHGHLFREFPLIDPSNMETTVADKYKDGFTQVQGKRKQGLRN